MGLGLGVGLGLGLRLGLGSGMGLGLVRVRILFTVAPAARPPSRPARGAAGVVDARAAEHGEGGAELCGRVALLRVRLNREV